MPKNTPTPHRVVPPPEQATKREHRRARRRAVLLTSTIVAGAAVVGSLLSDPDSRWYRSLDLPDWQPPPVAFPVAWTALYADTALTTGLAVARLRASGRPEEAASLVRALGANMAVNAAWTGVFFTAKRPDLATVVAGALALSSADLVRRVGRASTANAVALSAYPAWCGFATALSAAVWRRNR